MEATRVRRNRRTLSAVIALNIYQADYPDYDAEDWARAVDDAFTVSSVRAVARELASLSDWSLRGIEMSRVRLARRAGVGAGSVSRAVSKMSDAGYLVVSRRPVRKTRTGYTQYPDVYRLVIPAGPTWDMPFIRPGIDATDIPLYSPDAPDFLPWEKSPEEAAADRAYREQLNRLALGDADGATSGMRVPHAWTWLDTKWITQP